MPRVRLVNVDMPYKKIMQGRKWIGRTWKGVDGYYARVSGATSPSRIEVGPYHTERQAFDEVAARHFGQTDAAALRAHNAEVRASNRVVRGRRTRRGSSIPTLSEIERAIESLIGVSPRTHTPARRERTELDEEDFVFRTQAKHK